MAFPSGTELEILQYSTGAVTISPASGVSLLSFEGSGARKLAGQYAVVTLKTPCARAKFLSADAEIDLPGSAEIHLPPVKEGGVLWLESET